jgi:hypothetical protein
MRIDALKKMPHVPEDGGDGARTTINAISVSVPALRNQTNISWLPKR